MRAANSLDQYSIGCATITEDRMRASPTTDTIGNTATKSPGVPRWQFQGLNHRIEPRFLPLAILQLGAGQRMTICNGNLHWMDATKQGFAGIRIFEQKRNGPVWEWFSRNAIAALFSGGF